MYDVNGYNRNFNGYMSNIIQQPPTPQYQVQCFFVNSKDEAKNVQVQLNTIYLIINTPQKEIYLKKYNNDGLIDFIVYKDETTIPKQEEKQEKDYTGFFEEINKKIEDLQTSLKTPAKPVQPNYIKDMKGLKDEY